MQIICCQSATPSSSLSLRFDFLTNMLRQYVEDDEKVRETKLIW